jgi:hypothetical protein
MELVTSNYDFRGFSPISGEYLANLILQNSDAEFHWYTAQFIRVACYEMHRTVEYRHTHTRLQLR